MILKFSAAVVWKPIRKLLNPCFNLKILQSFVPIFNDKTNLMLNNLKKEVGTGPFDVAQYLHACTLDMVCGQYINEFPSSRLWSYLKLRSFPLWCFNYIYSLPKIQATTMGYNVDVQLDKNMDFLKSIEK